MRTHNHSQLSSSDDDVGAAIEGEWTTQLGPAGTRGNLFEFRADGSYRHLSFLCEKSGLSLLWEECGRYSESAGLLILAADRVRHVRADAAPALRQVRQYSCVRQPGTLQLCALSQQTPEEFVLHPTQDAAHSPNPP